MAKPTTRVAALVAVHNRLELTRRCVGCLQANRDSSLTLEIIVVDDGSTDRTSEWLATQSDVTVLSGDGGLWFGGATDLGLRFLLTRHEVPDFILVLNNDTFLRPGALACLLREQRTDTVVAAAYWTEDQATVSSAAFIWKAGRGLVNIVTTPRWPGGGGGGSEMSVDAVATTLVLIPRALLQRAVLPDASRHPHNRYDAILSARLRRAGARFVCTTGLLADHKYGALGNRTSVRMMRLSRFLTESFHDRRSVLHLKGALALAWEAPANRLEASRAVVQVLARFSRQLAWAFLNSLLPRSIAKRTNS